MFDDILVKSSKECDCGLWKEGNGYLLVTPSDCHDKGGHYLTFYDSNGIYQYTNQPWQMLANSFDLTSEEMLGAK